MDNEEEFLDDEILFEEIEEPLENQKAEVEYLNEEQDEIDKKTEELLSQEEEMRNQNIAEEDNSVQRPQNGRQKYNNNVKNRSSNKKESDDLKNKQIGNKKNRQNKFLSNRNKKNNPDGNANLNNANLNNNESNVDKENKEKINKRKSVKDKVKDVAKSSISNKLNGNKKKENKDNIESKVKDVKNKYLRTKKIVVFLVKNPPVAIALGVGLLMVFFIFIMMMNYEFDRQFAKDDGPGYTGYDSYNSNSYWWPIGSLETEEKDGALFASGTPAFTNITSGYGMRTMDGETSMHRGIDLAYDQELNKYPIIASRDGRVVNKIEGTTGYGNYVTIEHTDGNYTLYAHMYAGSITVELGAEVYQGQVIGYLGSTGNSTGPHLHYEVRVGGNDSSRTVDPLTYIDATNPRPIGVTGVIDTSGINVFKTSLSRDEFVSKMKTYSNSISGTLKTNFDNNFLAKAESIYNTSNSNNINPEIIVAFAEQEGSYKSCGSYNYWGYNITNDVSSCPTHMFDSIEEGIATMANTINGYATEGTSHYNSIMAKATEGKLNGCHVSGYGEPNTFTGIVSNYVYMGTYLVGPAHSTWGSGGCKYIDYFVNNNFMSEKYNQTYYNNRCASNSCSSPSNKNGDCGSYLTTPCEKTDYVAYNSMKRANILNKIFG